MLIPVHALDVPPATDAAILGRPAAVIAWQTAPLPTVEAEAGPAARIEPASPATADEAASPRALPHANPPVYSLPAPDGSDLPLRIKRGICSAIVAIPLSLYLYFSLYTPSYRAQPKRSRKTAGAPAPHTIRTIAHDV